MASLPALLMRPPLLTLSERLINSGRFRGWAQRFALTRPLVRRYERRLFDLMAGFTYSQVLTAVVRLRLLDALAGRACAPAELAPEVGLQPDALTTLLEAATALELTERRGERYGLGLLGMVLRSQPGLTALIEHHALLYADLRDPVALLRDRRGAGALGGYWAYAGNAEAQHLAPAQVASYSALMAATQPLIAAAILDAYPLARHGCLLDVGGGEGAFLRAAAARAPRLRLMLFELPAVVERARVTLGAAGLHECACHSGDFRVDPLPHGADVISLVRVAFDHDDATVLRLLRSVHAVLPPGGTLLLAEPMASAAAGGAVAYFALYLRAMGGGRLRSARQLAELVNAVGFVGIRLRDSTSSSQVGVLIAQRSSNSPVD